MEGYVLIASQNAKYFRLAANAARSIRFFDRHRPICLACDDQAMIATSDRHLFDDVVALDPNTDRRGTEHHLYLNQLSPYVRTLYLDTDCLVARPGLDDTWRKLAERHVAFPGRRLTEGKWRVDIPAIRALLGIDYVVQLNGGVFFFDRSPEAQRFFETAQRLFEDRGSEVSVRHHNGKGLANEPFWGTTHALTGTPEYPLREQLNVSTLRCEHWEITTEPGIRFWRDGGVTEPKIVHFLGIGGPKCPNNLYDAFLQVIVSGDVPAAPVTGPGPHIPEPAPAAA